MGFRTATAPLLRQTRALQAACCAAVLAASTFGGLAVADTGQLETASEGQHEEAMLEDTQLMQTSATRATGGGVGADALVSWLRPMLLSEVSAEELANMEDLVAKSKGIGDETIRQLSDQLKDQHPKAYQIILRSLHMTDEKASETVPELPLIAISRRVGQQLPEPMTGKPRWVRQLSAPVAIILIVLSSVVFCISGTGWQSNDTRATTTQPTHSAARLVARQLSALSWKNAKVSWRAELPMCFSCCNGCCCMFAPIIFIALLTALPSGFMHATGASRLLLVDHPLEYGRNYSVPSTWHMATPSLQDFLFMEPKESEQSAMPGLKAILLDPLTTPWHPRGQVPQGACYCRTLGAVGPGAENFTQFVSREYEDWISHQLSQEARWRQAVQLARGDMRRQLRMLFGVQEQECPAHDKRTFFKAYKSVGEVERMLDRYDYGIVDRKRSPDGGLDRLCGLVVFQNNPFTSVVPKYVIRTNVTGMDASGSVARRVVDVQQRGVQKQALGWYQQSGFLSIQEMVQSFVAEHRLGRKPARQPAAFVPLPADAFKLDKLKQTLAATVSSPEVCTATFSAVAVLSAFLAIRERNSKQKELMKLMGLHDSSLALSWLLLFAFQNTIISLGCSILVQAVIVTNSDFFTLFLIFFLTSMATTWFGLTISALISTERLGALVAFGAYQVMGLMCHGLIRDFRQQPLSGDEDQSSHASGDAGVAGSAHLFAASLLPNVAFVLCLKAYFALDLTPHGCSWSTWFHPIKNYSVGGGIAMLVVDFFVWGLAYAYLDQVVPHDVGTTRPPNFPFTRSFWRELLSLDSDAVATSRPCQENSGVADEEWGPAAHQRPAGGLFEAEDSERLCELRGRAFVVSVRGLRKHFIDGAGRLVRAVDGLDLTMYKGECFCLLGHNGAGKSTAMACLTGMLPPTAGEVSVCGKRMPEEKLAIRREMGFCMQQNVLWDNLTVEEHAQLFGALMGMTQRAIVGATGRVLAQVELLHKRRAQACHLSGGMRRKLSVALAMLGDSRVVVLDEPTAGMDPHTRRQLWGVLKQSRAERIMCLTTHHMDEADELGDRVCIMVQGRAACCGTNAFLKQQLGCGYLLNFVKVLDNAPDSPIEQLVRMHCGEGARVVAAAGRELRVQVPFARASAFPVLMKELDAKRSELNIESYGVGISDLEDVFLKVANGEAASPLASGSLDQGAAIASAPQARSAPGMAIAQAPAVTERVGSTAKGSGASFKRQFMGLFQRRVRYGRRDSRTFCCQLLMPTIIMVVFLLLSKVGMNRIGHYERVRVGVASWGGRRRALVTVGVPEADAWQGQGLTRAWQGSSELAQVCDVRFNTSLQLVPVPGKYPNKNRNSEELAFADFAFGRSSGDAPQIGGIMYSADRVTFFPNTTAHFAGPALLDLHFRAMMEAEGGRPLRMEVASQPFAATAPERGVIDGISGFAMGMVVFTAYSFIATGIAAYVTMEKELEVKQQLMVSGASPWAYWASNLTFDCVFGLVAFVSTLSVMALFGADEWCSHSNIRATVSLLLLFTPAVSLFAYFWSHFFNTSGSALIGVLMLGLFLGTFGINVSETLILFPATRTYGHIAMWIIQAVLPSACVGHGLMNLAMFKDFSRNMNISPFAGYITGTQFCSPLRGSLPCLVNAGDDCIMLVLDALVYACLIITIEVASRHRRMLQWMPWWRDPQCPSGLSRLEDQNVRAERTRVAGLDAASQVLVVDDVYKSYKGGVHAVRGITYAVGNGQVFGLLGVNGAGKTTTFKMLCGQIAPTAGRVLLRGRDMADDAAGARRLIGYCPQFDALLDLLTVREHLELYGQVKGLAFGALEAEVQQKLTMVDLVSFEHSRAAQLSGGNKRKLSFALSMVGEPDIIFLDEPSAGMDPLARRFMWEVIRSTAQQRPTSAVILTTHSMDEADALCSRIAVQCSGHLRCLGSPQELKQWYGTGLELNVRLEVPLRSDVEQLCVEWKGTAGMECCRARAAELVCGRGSWGATSLPAGSMLLGALAEWCLLQERGRALDDFLRVRCRGKVTRVEGVGGSLRYKLVGNCPGGGPLRYGELFALLGEHQKSLQVADFQLSQGTLEQTFNRLAAEDLERCTDKEKIP